MGNIDNNSVLHKLLSVIPNPMSLDKALIQLNIPDGVPFSVGELRKRATGMSQTKFAQAYHITLPTLRKWEREPERVTAAVRAYLFLIEKAPNFVRELVNSTAVQTDRDDGASNVDLKCLRKERLGLTRENFAFKYGLNERTLESWEVKPSSMTPPIRAYMALIDKAPELVHELLIATTKEEVANIIEVSQV